MAGLIDDLEFEEILPSAPFRELHSRVVESSIEQVWPECLAVTAREIRALGPLMAVRTLPAKFRGQHAVTTSQPKPLHDVFAGEGFVILRRDEVPKGGRAELIFGAAGKFWSLAHNSPTRFDGPQEFLDFAEPDYAKTVARLTAVDLGDGTTKIETETVIAGTDSASTRKFRPYWAVIRLPSGLIRRSWLAAIDRRATA